MTPWLLLTACTAALNLLAFIWVRGHWGVMMLPLAAASLLGTVAGHALGEALGITVLDIGDFHVVSASIASQLAMVAVMLLAMLAPRSEADPS